MFVVSASRVTEFHSRDRLIVAATICARPPRFTTGRFCAKSPIMSTTTPPNGRSSCRTSRSISSSFSISNRWPIGASSNTMRLVARISSPTSSFLATANVDVRSILSGTLNLEWKVRPLRKRTAAIPDVAVASAIFSCTRTPRKKQLETNVFPVPAAAFREKPPPARTAASTASYARLCSGFILFRSTWSVSAYNPRSKVSSSVMI